MIIGLDLSVIQTPHRMRGIGATAINFVNNLSDSAKTSHGFVFFLYEDGQDEALALLDLSGLDYEIRQLQPKKRIVIKLPRGSRIINGLLNNLRELVLPERGDPRIKDIFGLDAFLQFDPMQILPRSRKLRTGLIVYDLIPYILEADYLWTYKTARRNQFRRRSALRKSLIRHQYIARARSAAKSSDRLFAISNYTKADYVKYAGLKPNKINVIHLGVNNVAGNEPIMPSFSRYIGNSWGYFPQKVNLEDRPFLLFVGGADPRRKLNDLVAAFNNMRAEGYDLKLVLSGDTMKGPGTIPVTDVQKYIAESSYLDDIIFLGFTTNEQREWLFANATAMVYPSVYEGFGLPILEAMAYGTPVITYDNSSIREIAGDAALYAKDFSSIKNLAEQLIDDGSLRKKYQQRGKQQSAKFSWSTTVSKVLDDLTS